MLVEDPKAAPAIVLDVTKYGKWEPWGPDPGRTCGFLPPAG